MPVQTHLSSALAPRSSSEMIRPRIPKKNTTTELENTPSIRPAALSCLTSYAPRLLFFSASPSSLSVYLPTPISSADPFFPPNLLSRPTNPTALIHQCSSTPALSFSPLISLHAHSIAATIHTFLYNTSHTPRRIFHAFPCSGNEKVAATKANG
jgi:hypothetical protein